MDSRLHIKSSIFDVPSEPVRPVFAAPIEIEPQKPLLYLPRKAGENSVALAMNYDTPNVPDNPITSTVVQAVAHSGKPLGVLETSWRIGNGKLLFSVNRTHGLVELSIPDTMENRDVLEKSDTLLDTFGLVCMAGCHSAQGSEPAILHMTELLRAKGFSGYGEARKRAADKIARDIEFLSSIFFRVQDLPQLSGGKKKRIIFARSFSGQFMECARLDVESSLCYDTQWSMRFGLWANHYLTSIITSFTGFLACPARFSNGITGYRVPESCSARSSDTLSWDFPRALPKSLGNFVGVSAVFYRRLASFRYGSIATKTGAN